MNDSRVAIVGYGLAGRHFHAPLVDATRGLEVAAVVTSDPERRRQVSHLRASSVTAAPGPRLRVLGSEGAFIVEGVDGQEAALREGKRPDPATSWGDEPKARWGRFVMGEHSEPVPSEPGDWPEFYRLLALSLRDGGSAPVDPWDAVATLRVLEGARRSARERTVVALAPRGDHGS